MKWAFFIHRMVGRIWVPRDLLKNSIEPCACPNLSRVWIFDRSGPSVKPIPTPNSHKRGRESFFFAVTDMKPLEEGEVLEF